MTCIVGVVQDGEVVMGGDSAGVSGYALTVRQDPKVFHNGPFLIGYTTSFRMGQLLRFRFTPPPHHPADKDDYCFMATDFIDAVRDCFKDYGYAKIDSNREDGGTFLVGYRGRLYEISDDYQVGMNADPYAAVGCGAGVALGALHATQGQPANTRIHAALSAAERFSAGVRGPYVIERST